MFEFEFSPMDLESSLPSVGWLCTYTPEEIIYAAGFHPFRLKQNPPSIKMADAYLHSNLCPYVRSCLESGLRSEYPQLKGIVLVNSCDAMRSLYHVWRRYLSSSSFVHLMHLPRITSCSAVEFFKKEIQKLIEFLETQSGREIEESQIVEAVDVFNESRDLMQELLELKKDPCFPLTGSTVYRIVEAGQKAPKRVFNTKLKELIEEIKKQRSDSNPFGGPRIMISGSLLPNHQMIEIIESAGARVVCDDLCYGSRYFEGNVAKTDDLLMAISTHYLKKAPCARMKQTDFRLERAGRLAEAYRVDGVIYIILKFCDNHHYDFPFYREYFQARDIPVLQIEEDFLGGNTGQMRTRVEAFIEML
ncbi:MAG: 2-hydroxyacyl-CoA dehydratase subunit D [Candidatus Aminicenantales bacterium]